MAINQKRCTSISVWCKKIFSNYHIYKTSHMPYRHIFLYWIYLWNVAWLLFRWFTFIFTKHGKVKYHVIPRHCICIVSHITYHISHQSLGTSFYLVLWLVNKQIVHMFITLRQRKMGAILLTIFSNWYFVRKTKCLNQMSLIFRMGRINGIHNGLSPNMRQIIIGTDDGLV